MGELGAGVEGEPIGVSAGVESLIGETNVVYAATDGYGLVMAVAIAKKIRQMGKGVEIRAVYPDHSPRNFWAGEVWEGTLADTVFVVGVGDNRAQTGQRERALSRFRGEKVVLVSARYDSRPHILDKTAVLEAGLDGCLVRVAKAIMNDPELYANLNYEEAERLRDVALGVELASRPKPDLGVVVDRVAYTQEANRRIKETLKKLDEMDWGYFVGEAKEWRRSFWGPVVTVPAGISGERPGLCLVDLSWGVPVGFQQLVLEEAVRRTGARIGLGMVEGGIFGDETTWRLKVNPGSGGTSWIEEECNRLGVEYKGSERFGTIMVGSGKELGMVLAELLLRLEPELDTVYKGVRNVAVVGYPNRGKSVIAELLAGYCLLFSGQAARRVWEVDVPGVTPPEFLQAMKEYRKLTFLRSRGESVDEPSLQAALQQLEQETEKRAARKKQGWGEGDLEKVKRLILNDLGSGINFLDMPGGEVKKRDSQGQIVEVEIDVPQVVEVLELGPVQGVLILGKDKGEIDEWWELVGRVNANRKKRGGVPLKVLGKVIVCREIGPWSVARADLPGLGQEVSGLIPGADREALPFGNSGVAIIAAMVSRFALS